MRIAVRLAAGGGAAPSGVAAVVVDVLRATTTLTEALANGARRVVPAATPEEAFALKALDPDARLCGEREGLRIAGFDLGNSPAEYAAGVVAGRTLIFASTNGSRAMIEARGARRRLLGGFVNGSAVAGALRGEGAIVILCAGRLGRFCLEDAACAGWLCERLAAAGARLAGEAARLARSLAPRDRDAVRALVQGSAQGRHLRSLGPDYARDVERCADLDRTDRVFEF